MNIFLKRIREQMGISQKQLAEAVGVKQSTISKMESGYKSFPALEIKCSYALGRDPAKILGFEWTILKSVKRVKQNLHAGCPATAHSGAKVTTASKHPTKTHSTRRSLKSPQAKTPVSLSTSRGTHFAAGPFAKSERVQRKTVPSTSLTAKAGKRPCTRSIKTTKAGK